MRQGLVGFAVLCAVGVACSSEVEPGEPEDTAGSSNTSAGASGSGTVGGASNGGVANGGSAGANAAGEPFIDPQGGANSAGMGPAMGGDGPYDGAAGGGGELTGGAGEPAQVGGAGGQDNPPVTGPVHGRVLSGTKPVPDLTVIVGGSSTLTNANGEFEFATVASSYQLTLLSVTQKKALVVDGMSGRNPVVQFKMPAQLLPNTTTVSAHLDGASTGRGTRIGFIAADNRLFGEMELNTVPGGYALSTSWEGAVAQPGTLWAVSLRNVGSVRFEVASRPLTLQHGVPIKPVLQSGGVGGAPSDDGAAGAAGDGNNPLVWVSEGDLELEAANERTFTVEAPVLAGHTALANVYVGPFRYQLPFGSGPFDATVPVGTGLPLALEQRMSALRAGVLVVSAARQAVPASGGLAFDLEEAARQVLPIQAATGVTNTTEFTWTTVPDDQIARVTFDIGDWIIERVTSDAKTTVPDLAAFGVPLPKNRYSTWSLSTHGPATTVDEAARLEDARSATPVERYRIGPTYEYSSAAAISFTTAP